MVLLFPPMVKIHGLRLTVRITRSLIAMKSVLVITAAVAHKTAKILPTMNKLNKLVITTRAVMVLLSVKDKVVVVLPLVLVVETGVIN